MVKFHFVAAALALALFSAHDSLAGKVLDRVHTTLKGGVAYKGIRIQFIPKAEIPTIQKLLQANGVNITKIDGGIELSSVRQPYKFVVVAGKVNSSGCLIEFLTKNDKELYKGKVLKECIPLLTEDRLKNALTTLGWIIKRMLDIIRSVGKDLETGELQLLKSIKAILKDLKQ